MTDQLHLGVALDGYGWHPQAWRTTLAADPTSESVLSGRYWAGLAATAERGLLDFLTIDDTLMPQPGRREGSRRDGWPVAATPSWSRRASPRSLRHIGLIPVATVTHTEPFHVSKAIATLDYVSHGRAGWQPRVSSTAHEAALFGRRQAPIDADELFDEAADAVEVVRRLWDSWEDDAMIRDVATGRYVDRNKLHYVDFAGKILLGQGPVDHTASAAGPAGGGRAGPRGRVSTNSPRPVPISCSSRRPMMRRSTPSSTRCKAAGGQHLKVYADVVVTFGGDTDFGSDALDFRRQRNRIG